MVCVEASQHAQPVQPEIPVARHVLPLAFVFPGFVSAPLNTPPWIRPEHSRRYLLQHGPLETIPIEVGIGLHPWTIICQRNQGMSLQWNPMKITLKWLPIDVDLPPICLIQLAGIA